ncbi:protein adenylyltransferase SelO [Aurantimonas coralicida]|uniref:protein adenylyltransferase SelO n=1 Tax=Aurantimonas coralicida TaxID=182270 RepID=UPI001D19002D|nr:YdiU family protein [Aurantimonas coralicida]MCC4296011.1 YdiU family protein [Aurantimonas coralicida]
MNAQIPFDNSYARLPADFYAQVAPAVVDAPQLIKVNRALAAELGIDADMLETPEGVDMLAGKRLPEGAEPIAMAYAGHQFGHFVPQLGDGRAILLGEVVDTAGRRRDLQLKGAGRTPFSRGGDGRAALGPVMREYIVSEAMAALGVPTTRALAAVTTGESVFRETLLPGAVLTRVASSHIRVGTFQYFAARGDDAALRALSAHAIARHYPEAAEAEDPYLALIEAVAGRQAELVARWLNLGFIHGVMNTDNMAISGETIDYGPCAFLDAYHPGTVFSAIDRQGRYAYANQPSIALWNLTRLAETLLPLIDTDEKAAIAKARDALSGFSDRFNAAYVGGLQAKLGLGEAREGDLELAQDLLERMAANTADYTLTFRRLCDAADSEDADAGVRAFFDDPAAYDEWATRWRARLAEEAGSASERAAAMRRVNPAFIPRNHRVEAAIVAAVERQDYAPFEELLAVLANPYDDQPEHAAYAEAPRAEERVTQTFCGT